MVTTIINEAYDDVFLKYNGVQMLALTDDGRKQPLMIDGNLFFVHLGMKFKWLEKTIEPLSNGGCRCNGNKSIYTYKVRCWAEQAKGKEYPFDKVETFLLQFTNENDFEETLEVTPYAVRESVLDKVNFKNIDLSVPSVERSDWENKEWIR